MEKTAHFDNHVNSFLWLDRHGQYHRVDKMGTRHLYFTLRMIWNHTMPKRLRSASYNVYAFSPFYTKGYFSEAAYSMLSELVRRRDIASSWRSDVDKFVEHFNAKLKKQARSKRQRKGLEASASPRHPQGGAGTQMAGQGSIPGAGNQYRKGEQR